jgi:hypothetical protein
MVMTDIPITFPIYCNTMQLCISGGEPHPHHVQLSPGQEHDVQLSQMNDYTSAK